MRMSSQSRTNKRGKEGRERNAENEGHRAGHEWNKNQTEYESRNPKYAQLKFSAWQAQTAIVAQTQQKQPSKGECDSVERK